jgi:hypothetical protein
LLKDSAQTVVKTVTTRGVLVTNYEDDVDIPIMSDDETWCAKHDGPVDGPGARWLPDRTIQPCLHCRIEELEAALSRATAECNKLNNYDSYQPHDFMEVTP